MPTGHAHSSMRTFSGTMRSSIRLAKSVNCGGREPAEALRHGVAAGSAALVHAGTSLCQTDDLWRLLAQARTRQLRAGP